MKKCTIAFLCVILLSSIGFAQQPTISSKTLGMEKHTGFFTYYWDEKAGKIWLEIDKFDTEFLFINSMTSGLGSNNVGLDRNSLGSTKIVKFQRIGPKVLLVQPNYSYRAATDNPYEQKAVEEAFAQSVIWGFQIAAEENSKVLVDASPFLLRDGYNAIGTLSRSNQGAYRLDASRSAFYLPSTKNFPQNTEFEVILTFVGESPGNYIRSVTPDATAITLRQRYSLVQLPDDGYETREYDPRSAAGSVTFLDFAKPISEPILMRFARRHRLKKKNPDAAVSEPVEPIIYYVDRGVPEPVRSALIEGANWWNEAFEAAGYKDAFQVKLMPEDADLMDVRYNVINWIHRSTRGWSSGGSVTDPRTGEIIKGHVKLGSQRVRQDFLIAVGLLAPYEEGKPVSKEMEEMALARIRQLSVHEVGHTLGFGHNYMASVFNRASVMDYPHPLVKIDDDGSIDLSDAYAEGIGEWDKVSIEWNYQDFPNGVDEKKALDKILTDAMERGIFYISNQDATSPGTAHPYAHQWDNGANAVDELERVMKIRSLALERFSENNIRMNTPMATLEDVLVPIYLFHRYQITAASKVLGGADYIYAFRGDGQNMIIEIVPPEEQRRALDALLETINPEALALDERILNLIPPRPPGYGQTTELFGGHTGLTFDLLTAAETVANMTIPLILNAERSARLVEYHARNNQYPGLNEVLDKLVDSTWKSVRRPGYPGEIQRVVDTAVLHNLMNLAVNQRASTQVRAITSLKIDELKNWLDEQSDLIMEENQKAHIVFALSEIDLFQKDPDKVNFTLPLAAPSGAPIGMQFNDLFEYNSIFQVIHRR